MPLHNGWDIVYTEPGQCEQVICRVCGETMKAERDVTGPTGWAEAMAKKGHPHDTFYCTKAKEKWHVQVRKLKQLALQTPSAKVTALYEQEIAEILAAKTPTKEVDDVY